MLLQWLLVYLKLILATVDLFFCHSVNPSCPFFKAGREIPENVLKGDGIFYINKEGLRKGESFIKGGQLVDL